MSRNTQLILIIVLIIIGFGLTLGVYLFNNQQKKISNSTNYDSVEKPRVTRLKLENESGETFEIFSNGRLVASTKNGDKSAILAYDQLNKILTYAQGLDWNNLQDSYSTGKGKKYTLTIETTEGTKTIVVIIDDFTTPKAIKDLIEIIEDIVLPIIYPSPIPTSSPVLTSSPRPSTSPHTLYPSPTPVQLTDDYSSMPPFKCSDLSLEKSTAVSNTVCTPGDE